MQQQEMKWTKPKKAPNLAELRLLDLQPTTRVYRSHFVKDKWVAVCRCGIGYGATREEACEQALRIVRWERDAAQGLTEEPPYLIHPEPEAIHKIKPKQVPTLKERAEWLDRHSRLRIGRVFPELKRVGTIFKAPC